MNWIHDSSKAPNFLGDVPSGFYETNCDPVYPDTDPAFVRGVLLGRSDYLAMTLEQRRALEQPPRWTLYIGPVLDRARAISWDSMMFIWAAQNKLVWLPLGTPCIVRSNRTVPWPYREARWEWVYEYTHPRQVSRVYSGGKYVYVYPDGSVAAA